MGTFRASPLTRRQLFQYAGGAAALAFAPALFLGRPALAARGGSLTLDQVLPHVGSRFDVWLTPTRPVSLALIDATDATPTSLGRRRVTGDAFSLLFGGSRAQVPAGTYPFRHPTLGSFQLFVSPVGRGVNGQRYEVVVNHLALA